MVMAIDEAVRSILDEIIDPCSASAGAHISILDMGIVTHSSVSPDGDVVIMLRATMPGCFFIPMFENEIKERASAVAGVRSVTVDFVHDYGWTEDEIAAPARERLRIAREERRHRIGQAVEVQIGRRDAANGERQ